MAPYTVPQSSGLNNAQVSAVHGAQKRLDSKFFFTIRVRRTTLSQSIPIYWGSQTHTMEDEGRWEVSCDFCFA
jgi:hypothetical protein